METVLHILSQISSENKSMWFLTLFKWWNDSWINRWTGCISQKMNCSTTSLFRFKMLLLQILRMGQDHTQWDSCMSAHCSSALSNSHDGISWNTVNFSWFPFPLEEETASASTNPAYWCRQGLEQRNTMCETLQISVKCPRIQLTNGKWCSSH